MIADGMMAGSLQTNSGAGSVYESSILTNWSHAGAGAGAHDGSAYYVLHDVYPSYLVECVRPGTRTVAVSATPSHATLDSKRTDAEESFGAVDVMTGPPVVPVAPAQSEVAVQTQVEAVAATMVRASQQFLSLNITELAKILGVERATVYGWLRGTIQMPREQEKRDRLALIFAVSQAWRERQRPPLGAWRLAPLSDGRSFVEAISMLSPASGQTHSETNALIERVIAAQEEANVVRARTEAGRAARELARGEADGRSVGSPNQHETKTADDAFDNVLGHLDWFEPND